MYYFFSVTTLDPTPDLKNLLLSALHQGLGRMRAVYVAPWTVISGLPRHFMQVCRINGMHTLDRDFTSWWAPRGIQTCLQISQNSFIEPVTNGSPPGSAKLC
jgi:hypothetical protein